MVDQGYKRWDQDPYSWGGPTGLPAIGLLTRAGRALRQPIGPIHWAGTESAVYWQGYMDGAVTSGYRAADEVSAALG
jgi:monoamine oxidase